MRTHEYAAICVSSPNPARSLTGEMPGPWVQGELNPGWLASQDYPAGSFVEFNASWPGAKARCRALATVISSRSKGDAGTWLAIQIKCVENGDLLHWLGIGGGAKLKGRLELHLCHGKAAECNTVVDGMISEIHTDTLRKVEGQDLVDRASGWWTADPARSDFEALRARILAGRNAKAKASISRSAAVEVAPELREAPGSYAASHTSPHSSRAKRDDQPHRRRERRRAEDGGPCDDDTGPSSRRAHGRAKPALSPRHGRVSHQHRKRSAKIT